MTVIDVRAVDQQRAFQLVERLASLAGQIVLEPTASDASTVPLFVVSCRPTDDPGSLTRIVSLADRYDLDTAVDGGSIRFEPRES